MRPTTGYASERGLRALAFLLLALYPWVVLRLFPGWPGGEGGWILPKLLLLLFLGLLTFPAWFPHARRLKVFALLLALLTLSLVSSLLALGKDESTYIVLGPEGRMDGLLYGVGLFLFGGLALWLLREEEGRRMGQTLLLLSGALQGGLLLLQRNGVDPMVLLLKPDTGVFPTLTGTAGQSGMAAGLLLPLVPLAIGAVMEGRRAQGLLSLALLSMGLGATVNRTGLVALGAGLCLWVLLRREGRLLLLALFSLALVFGVSQFWPNRSPERKVYAESYTLKTRLLIWELALKALKDPRTALIGGGPDGFRYALMTRIPLEDQLPFYLKEYHWPPKEALVSVEPLFRPEDPLRYRAYLLRFKEGTRPERAILRILLDKAHNAFLDKALAYGLPYAFLWLLLFFGPLPRLLQERSPLAFSLLALFIYYLTWFPVPQTEPWHLFLALWGWQEASQGHAARPG